MKSGAWIVAAIIVVALLAYSLDRGLHVGSSIVRFQGSGGEQYWGRDCRYLFPSGITVVRKGGWNLREEAENEYCRMFRL